MWCLPIILFACLLLTFEPVYSNPTSPKLSSDEDAKSAPPSPPPRPFGVEVKGGGEEIVVDKQEIIDDGIPGSVKDDTEVAKAHKAFVPHPHIQPPKNPSPTSPLHLPPTGYELSAIIIVLENGNSAFAAESAPHRFPYVPSEGPSPLSTRDLRPSKTVLSHAAMGSSGEWVKSGSGAHGGGDLVVCLSRCEVEVSGGQGERVRTFQAGSSLLFKDYYGAGHRIYSHSEPLQILTINLKRDCVGDDCGEGWMEGNNGTKTTKEIIKKKVQSQVPSNIDILGYVFGGTLAGVGGHFFMKVLPVYVVMVGMGEKAAEIAAEIAAAKAAKEGEEGGEMEKGETDKSKQDAADREAAAAGGAD
ncbi:hypothetical protein TrRE_jg4516 [Triparma retinervis]|uniref:Uncharacterized protein n=1 Tax=Triparma retinervis TaxID=2557542 RepID=A0A9W7E6E5_9STRA|nr:hypothetical protein TrRE_jg4516 [Triparma retinervis]